MENSWTYHRCGYKSDKEYNSDKQYIYDVLTPPRRHVDGPCSLSARNACMSSQLHWAHVRLV